MVISYNYYFTIILDKFVKALHLDFIIKKSIITIDKKEKYIMNIKFIGEHNEEYNLTPIPFIFDRIPHLSIIDIIDNEFIMFIIRENFYHHLLLFIECIIDTRNVIIILDEN